MPVSNQQSHCTFLPQRILEPDAERCCGGDRRHSGGFLLRIMPPSWHPVPACVRSGILQAEPFSFAAMKIRIGRGALLRRGQAPLRRLFTLDYAAFVTSSPRLRPQRHPAGETILLCRNGILQAKPFSSAATNIRIGRGALLQAGTGATPAAFYLGLCRLRDIQSPPASATASCRRNHSPLPQRRLEPDAESCCGGD